MSGSEPFAANWTATLGCVALGVAVGDTVPAPQFAVTMMVFGSLDNPELVVYRITPARVRYMQEWALDYYEVPFEKSS